MKVIEMAGKKFNSLVVIRRSFTKNRKIHWSCRCKCGNIVIVWGCYLRSGHTKSCGCLLTEVLIKRNVAMAKHGKSHSITYNTWGSMIARCCKKQSTKYPMYGAKGIKVCERWMDFENFLADMGERPSTQYSIDRYPDRTGNYEPGNCRWATLEEQGRNKKNNRYLELNGERRCLSEWVEVTGLSRSTIRGRLKRGWTHERTLTTPNLNE